MCAEHQQCGLPDPDKQAKSKALTAASVWAVCWSAVTHSVSYAVTCKTVRQEWVCGLVRMLQLEASNRIFGRRLGARLGRCLINSPTEPSCIRRSQAQQKVPYVFKADPLHAGSLSITRDVEALSDTSFQSLDGGWKLKHQSCLHANHQQQQKQQKAQQQQSEAVNGSCAAQDRWWDPFCEMPSLADPELGGNHKEGSAKDGGTLLSRQLSTQSFQCIFRRNVWSRSNEH